MKKKTKTNIQSVCWHQYFKITSLDKKVGTFFSDTEHNASKTFAYHQKKKYKKLEHFYYAKKKTEEQN